MGGRIDRDLSPAERRRWTRVGALSALAMALGYLESFVPIPIPGVRLGLANVPILVALAQGDARAATMVALVKVMATSLLFGNPVTLAYSCTGTLLALVCMVPLARLRTMRIEMVSVVGALAHEAGQLLVAQALLGTPLVWYGAPLLGVAGCVTGLLCGIVAGRLAAMTGTDVPATVGRSSCPDQPQTDDATSSPLPAGPLCIAFVAFVALAMHTRSLVAFACLLAASCAGCLVARVPLRTVRAALAPLLPIAAIAMVAQVASTQQGTELFAFGPVRVTAEACAASAVMLARLTCISLASVTLAVLLRKHEVASLVHGLMRPLMVLGIDARGPELAVSTALALVPALGARLEASKEGRPHLWSRAFWTNELPQLTAELYAQADELAKPENNRT